MILCPSKVDKYVYDGAAQKVAYTYDDLGRVTTRTAECGSAAGKLTSSYAYVDGAYGTNSTTPLVKKITQNGISFEYTYDTRGNIVSEKCGNLTTTYAYDALGQLIRVNDPHENATWVYNYDRGGNITSKVKYAYTTGALGAAVETIPYVYGDSNWKDKLTAYNGTAITYDAIGNPLNDGAWAFTWAAGRQLKKMVREDRTLDFKYDHNGMRIQKVLQHDWYPETTNYTYHGKLLTHMTVDYHDWDEVAQQDKLHFFYDAQSRPVKISYNGVIYTYVHNLQGDIVGILDSTGALVVEYKYDAWGKLLSTTGSLADTLGKRNPFRYRSYIYDEESELYWVKNRYYYPEQYKFINADTSMKSIRGVSSLNLYAYCRNVPIHTKDIGGTDLIVITASEGAANFGHTSVLIQDENDDWYYYYFGPNADAGYFGLALGITVDAGIIYEKISLKNDNPADVSFFSALTKLTNELHDEAGLGRQTYDRAIYLEGDYTNSHKTALEQKRQESSQKYNLYSNNCVLNSMKIIEATLRDFTTKLNTYMLNRKGENVGLSTLIGSIIPNYVHSMMEGYFKK